MSKNYNNNNSKSRGKSSKGKDFPERRSKDYEEVKALDRSKANYASKNICNDPSDYVPTDQNIKDVANFSLNNILGSDYHIDEFYRDGGSRVTNRLTFSGAPGTLSIVLMPTVGVAKDNNSAINVAANDLYNEIRRANSGTKVYDAPDCMQVVVAIAQVYSAITWAQRLYGLANVYSSSNNYLPKALISGNGVDPDDLRRDMNHFRTQLNNLVLQANTFNVPKSIPLFKHWCGIYEKVYADSNTAKAQIYQYVPLGFYKYDDVNAKLTLDYFMPSDLATKLSAQNVIDKISAMIDKLVYSEDARTISADIEKAFGTAGLYNVGMIDESYSVIPDMSDEIRSQIMNAKILHSHNTASRARKNDIVQSPNKDYLVADYHLELASENVGNMGNWWLNTHASQLTPEEVMCSTRLVPTFTAEVKTHGDNYGPRVTVAIDECSSEIAVDGIISTFARNADKAWTYNEVYVESCVLITNGNYVRQVMGLCLLSAFDWAPRVNFYTTTEKVWDDATFTSTKGHIDLLGSILDYDQGAVIAPESLNALHKTAMLGLFGVPRIRA